MQFISFQLRSAMYTIINNLFIQMTLRKQKQQILFLSQKQNFADIILLKRDKKIEQLQNIIPHCNGDRV